MPEPQRPDAYRKPVPSPSPETQRFWEACKRHELLLPFCRACQKFYFFPRDFCPTCFGWDIEWRRCSGRGTLYTYGIQYRAWHPGWAGEVPYVSALVDLEEGPRMYTNLVDVEPGPKAIRCGMPVEVVWDDVTADVTLPKFRPVR